MPSDDFPNAPDIGHAFESVKRTTPTDKAQEGPQHYPEIDRLDLSTRDYTPGGTLEQEVHTGLSDNARREYQERMQRAEPPEEDYYLDQIQQRFDEQIKEADRKREEEQMRDAAEKENTNYGRDNEQADQGNEQEKPRQPHNYDMPEKETTEPLPKPPAHGVKPRPGRTGGHDRSDDGHEH
ncbi:hypothetical protein [Adhaeretor mobilis]|uniref:Uncharacterized protein n=1 Tax=Adhaeretor mobilis TaxID=1930276 RepID=A0A517MQC7_9BACT|nr:hypothetical protein [Adhaeretor mobilis]QDS97081.1 hypothetical protein HG15A2_03400 [Adhaeretor mobilis]